MCLSHLSFVCISAYANVYVKTTSESTSPCVHCGSAIRFGQALLGFLIPAHHLYASLELAFWLLCSAHAVIQVSPDGVVGSRNCCCHSCATCTVDVTVCFTSARPSVLLPRASRGETADPLLIASCLSWSENWLLAYCLPLPSPIVSFTAMGFFCHSDACPA